MKQIEITIEGLSCANCAAKIEKVMNERNDIYLANLDFSTSTLILEVDDDYSIDNYDSIEKDILKIESVNVLFDSSEKEQNIPVKKNYWWLKIILGSIALLVSLLSDSTLARVFVLSIYLYIGYPVLNKALLRIKSKQWFDENFLMSIATIGALMINEWPEAIGVMLFYTVGEYFQDKAVKRSLNAIASLLDIQVHEAILFNNKESIIISPQKVKINDLILVPVGSKIACDGIVIEGSSSLNVASLTGESLPIDVKPGTSVLAGSINLQQSLVIKVTSLYKDSSIAKLAKHVKEASKRKAKLETTMTRFASIYTPFVVFSAILLFVILVILGVPMNDAIYRSLVFLVISCPCALVISVPLSYFAAMGYASKKGILFKGGVALESARKVNALLFDKTGTVTVGNLVVTNEVQLSDNLNLARNIAFSLEQHSNHPIAKSIIRYLESSSAINIENVSENIGLGMQGMVNDLIVEVRKITSEEINNHLDQQIDLLDMHQKTWVGVFMDNQCLLLFSIEDEIKPTARPLFEVLKIRGIKTGLLSGDRQAVVNIVKDIIHVEDAYGDLLPQDKVRIAQQYMEKYHVGFIGDGINDSSVLATAHLGIAMGSKGSDLAIEASDVVLLNDDLNTVNDVLTIAHQSHKSIIQNLTLVFVVKGVVLLFGSLGLMGMWEAVFADVGVALLAIFNAMRILYSKK
ncbi:MAG: heavy metal translocating P-type ATPase [Erysipelothrix sp.]|nr:heavy metal translocating P-type ATPase [Erysipelothrix sp.]